MAYSDQYTVSQNAAFKIDVGIAIVKASLNTIFAARSDNAADDRAKHALAVRVLLNPTELLNNFCIAAAADDSITLASTNAEVQARVDAIFAAIAGTNKP